jgi:hypothetical protein
MVASGPQDGSSGSRKLDGEFAWRLAVAMVATLFALPMILSIILAPVGIPLLLAGCKPLKDYFVRKSNESAERQLAIISARRKNGRARNS